MSNLHYARALNEDEAKVILFGADSNHAGFAPSYQTERKVERKIFSADYAREAENKSPSLSEHMVIGSHLFDAGNLQLPEGKDEQIQAMKAYFQKIYTMGKLPLCLGGDHLVKYAGITSALEHNPNTYVIYLDAHPDCHMTDNLYYGSILHHVFKNYSADPKQVVLLGLRQANLIEKEGFDHYKMPTIFGMDFSRYSVNDLFDKIKGYIPSGSSIYFSIDLDGFDPADTPGVEQPCPGGPRINEFIALMHCLSSHYSFSGMDITEFLPVIDKKKLTALAMMRLAKEFYACQSTNIL